MTTPDLSVMSEATRLTREGRLLEATALLQRRPGETVHPASEFTRTPIGDPQRPDLRSLVKGMLHQKLDGMLHQTFDRGSADLPLIDQSASDTERPYLLHLPTSITGPAPLIVMLHGGTQDAATFQAATGMNALADAHGFHVAYPEQVASANPMKYWNWFSPNDQERGRGEPAIIAGIVRDLVATHPVDPERVYIAGFSAGAAMAAVLAATYPDVFAGVGVHSGLAYGAADNVVTAFAAMRSAPPVASAARPVPIIVFHGDADPTVDSSNATAVFDQFCPRGLPRAILQGSAGRGFTRVSVGDDRCVGELWTVHGAGHAWSGGVPGGSYTDPGGPNASAELVRFFAQHRLVQAR